MRQLHRVLINVASVVVGAGGIDKSPHGRSKLQTLTVVGQLTS